MDRKLSRTRPADRSRPRIVIGQELVENLEIEDIVSIQVEGGGKLSGRGGNDAFHQQDAVSIARSRKGIRITVGIQIDFDKVDMGCGIKIEVRVLDLDKTVIVDIQGGANTDLTV